MAEHALDDLHGLPVSHQLAASGVAQLVEGVAQLASAADVVYSKEQKD